MHPDPSVPPSFYLGAETHTPMEPLPEYVIVSTKGGYGPVLVFRCMFR